jgi:diguanylate cyclase (GGDEF)-like protein
MVIYFMETSLMLNEGKVYVIGRSVRSDIALPHGSVSRKHAVIEWVGSGFILRDLQSTNGTYLNGARMTEARLNPGDKIRIGEFDLLISAGGEDEDAEAGMPMMQTMQIGVSFADLLRGEGVDPEKLTLQVDPVPRDAPGTDELTGLINRAQFDHALTDEVQISHEFEQDLALILLDVDGFAGINEAQGRARGDAILQAIAGVLRDVARANDTPARFGGDAFALLAADVSPADAARLAATVRTLAASASGAAVSAGVANLGGATNSPARLVEAAESALQQAKGEGGNRAAG